MKANSLTYVLAIATLGFGALVASAQEPAKSDPTQETNIIKQTLSKNPRYRPT